MILLSLQCLVAPWGGGLVPELVLHQALNKLAVNLNRETLTLKFDYVEFRLNEELNSSESEK